MSQVETTAPSGRTRCELYSATVYLNVASRGFVAAAGHPIPCWLQPRRPMSELGGASAGGGDLCLGRGREGVRTDVQRNLDVAATEDLDR